MKSENNLLKVCKIKGLSVRELSEKTEIPFNTLLSLSSGKNDLKKTQIATVVKIANGLGCKLDDLFIEKDFKKELKKVK